MRRRSPWPASVVSASWSTWPRRSWPKPRSVPPPRPVPARAGHAAFLPDAQDRRPGPEAHEQVGRRRDEVGPREEDAFALAPGLELVRERDLPGALESVLQAAGAGARGRERRVRVLAREKRRARTRRRSGTRASERCGIVERRARRHDDGLGERGADVEARLLREPDPSGPLRRGRRQVQGREDARRDLSVAARTRMETVRREAVRPLVEEVGGRHDARAGDRVARLLEGHVPLQERLFRHALVERSRGTGCRGRGSGWGPKDLTFGEAKGFFEG